MNRLWNFKLIFIKLQADVISSISPRRGYSLSFLELITILVVHVIVIGDPNFSIIVITNPCVKMLCVLMKLILLPIIR